MKQHQYEVDRIAEVDNPERTERVSTRVLNAEDKDEEKLQSQQNPREPCNVKSEQSVINRLE